MGCTTSKQVGPEDDLGRSDSVLDLYKNQTYSQELQKILKPHEKSPEFDDQGGQEPNQKLQETNTNQDLDIDPSDSIETHARPPTTEHITDLATSSDPSAQDDAAAAEATEQVTSPDPTAKNAPAAAGATTTAAETTEALPSDLSMQDRSDISKVECDDSHGGDIDEEEVSSLPRSKSQVKISYSGYGKSGVSIQIT